MTLQRDPSVISGTNHLIMKSRLIHSYSEIWSYSNMFSLVLHSGEIQTNSESSLVHCTFTQQIFMDHLCAEHCARCWQKNFKYEQKKTWILASKSLESREFLRNLEDWIKSKNYPLSGLNCIYPRTQMSQTPSDLVCQASLEPI